YGMGRENALPRSFFGAIDPRRNIPRNNVLLVGAMALVGGLALTYQLGAEMLNFGAFIAFMGVNLAAFTHYWVRAERRRVLDHVTPLTIETVSRIHFRGGSHIGISRANPSLKQEHLENTVTSLLRLNVSQLITIGGDDTAYSAMKLEERAGGRIRVAHVPKT